MKKLSYQEVKKYIEENEYSLLSDEYKNNKTKLKMMCPNGHTFEMKFNSYKSGSRCPMCHGNIKLTYDYVKEYINNEGYELLSKTYINNHTKLKVKCPKGHIFEVKFNHFKNGSRCPECCGNRKYTHSEVNNIFKNEGYTLLSETYINKDSKLKVKCPKGHIYYTNLNVFKRGFRCPHCSGKAKHTIDFIQEYLYKEGYKLLSFNYTNANKPIKIECPNGHIFKMSFGDFKNNNRRCPICSASKGERKIIDILNKLNVQYIPQHKFDNCKFKKSLMFDFYLPNYNCCIEFDGEQHYEIIDVFGGFDGFVDTKIRDTVKNVYCDNNNISLIRIPYWEFDNIEEIIMNKIYKIS